jgi:hypothetical protein
LPTAAQEFQFAYDHNLMAYGPTREGYDAIRVVMRDRESAESLMKLIEAQHGEVDNLSVRKSKLQGGRWVVQLPAYQAFKAGLLPRGLGLKQMQQSLPLIAIGYPDSLSEAREAARRDAETHLSWVNRIVKKVTRRER